jgi:hypothetical protein
MERYPMADVEPKPGEQSEEESPPEAEPEQQDEAQDEEKSEDDEKTEPDEGEEPQDKAAAKPEAEPDAEEKRKRAGGWQRKIERLERQNEQLIAQLTGQRQVPAAAKPPSEKTPEEKAAEYIDGLVAKRLAEADAQRQQRAAVAEFQRRTAAVRAGMPDFDDVVMSADMPISPALEQALLTSEHGPAIMYKLAKNPGELARLSALPPLDAAREIGRLEAQQASSTASPKTTKPALRPPAPPTSVNGSASSTRSLDDLPLAEYKRAMRSRR